MSSRGMAWYELETDEPISAEYTLELSSGKIVTANFSKIFSWDRDACKFFHF